jgi:hypothetical protein
MVRLLPPLADEQWMQSEVRTIQDVFPDYTMEDLKHEIAHTDGSYFELRWPWSIRARIARRFCRRCKALYKEEE